MSGGQNPTDVVNVTSQGISNLSVQIVWKYVDFG